MVNNIYTTKEILPSNLGGVDEFRTNDNKIKIKITGELGIGCLLFDSSGTIGVITSFTDENNFDVTTYAVSINIPTILGLAY